MHVRRKVGEAQMEIDKELKNIDKKVEEIIDYVDKVNQKDRRELILFFFNTYLLAFIIITLPEYLLSAEIGDKVFAIIIFIFVLGFMTRLLIIPYFYLYDNSKKFRVFIKGKGPTLKPFKLSTYKRNSQGEQAIHSLKGEINHLIFNLTNTSFSKWKKMITITSLISLFSGFVAFTVYYHIPLLNLKILVAFFMPVIPMYIILILFSGNTEQSC
jgi:hypothetical protein